MKIRNLKTKMTDPILLLILMACMHLGDGRHSGDHHSMVSQPSYQSSIHGLDQGNRIGIEGMTILHDFKDIG